MDWIGYAAWRSIEVKYCGKKPFIFIGLDNQRALDVVYHHGKDKNSRTQRT